MESFDRIKLKELFIFLLILYPFIFYLGYYVKSIDTNQQMNINIHVPNTFNLTFYDLDNETIIYQSNYSVYMIMLSGFEIPNGNFDHIHHFINDLLLAYFLDVGLYNLSYMCDEFLLNGKILEWEFEYDKFNDYYGIGAFDFSMFNDTNHYAFMDFGNTQFLNLTLEKESHIYLNEISCYHEYDNIYRPFLNFTYNNQLFMEKHAWNITIPF